MEISIYNLQKNNEEFKDLTYDQLMKIGELCLKYYNDGQKDTYDNTNEDLQSEIDELTNQVEDLESKIDCYETMQDDLIDLMKDCYNAENKKEVKENIEDFANSHKYEYVWDFIDKK